ncbi:cysteine hydrolase [Bacillus haynesii]|uniref:cysteine hydrolase n=1 Tax=Bacillus haynesii TaxID=1925021 RepID=UPI002280D1F4|nr:cysteine hydrolase [Bacillus haynesii]MCY7999075.1 cysteine hydrolase [Bacillus haynesii]MCY9264905.1 cysteine hydrolase [Bacillus haynesii]MEC0698470.1 cysteine hydrolase [Bacillus haynesii]
MDIALLVLDIQKDYISDQAQMSVAKHQIDPMLERVNTIIDKFKNRGIPVVYVGNEFEPKKFIGNFLRKNSALKGSEGAELGERLLRVNDIYFSKNKGNALSNLELVSYLNSNEVKHIVIVGLFAEACVTATALDSIRKNSSVTVVKDAVASSNDSKREKSLNYLNSRGIAIIDSSQLFKVFLN